jgi:fatty-acyl-CoA synthase
LPGTAGDCRIIISDRFDASTTGALIERERVSVVNGSDDMFHRLLATDADLSSIRVGGYARFNSSLDGIVARAAERGCRLVGLYGMSEVQALFAHRRPSADEHERELAGGALVSDDAAVRIVDGELHLQGPSLFEGYLADGGAAIDTELTARAFDRGWFRTGDAASSDDDRTFTYLSRLGDAIRLGGFLVAPAEIESAILDFEGITAAQVVAVERAEGARPVAFVTGRPTMSEKDMISALGILLAVYKVPVRIVPVDSFPTTPSANGDKIQLGRLRTLATELVEKPNDVEISE